MTRTITFSTPKRFWAIWAMIRLVLSPSGRGDEHVGALDPGLDQGVDLQRRADRELALGVLPALALARVQTLVRERILVEHRNFVARRQRGLGDRRADAAGTDDQDEHEIRGNIARTRRLDDAGLCSPGPAGGCSLPGDPPATAAGAVTITRQVGLARRRTW